LIESQKVLFEDLQEEVVSKEYPERSMLTPDRWSMHLSIRS